MNPDKLGELFVRLMPTLRGLVHVPTWLPEDDVLNEALAELLEKAAEVPEAEAEAVIRGTVEEVSKRMLAARNLARFQFPSPAAWYLQNRYVGPPEDDSRDDRDPIANIPDDRPDAEEALTEAAQAQAVTRLVERIEGDPGPKGQLYRLLYIEKRSVSEIAQILGITYAAVGMRMSRLRRELREALDATS